MKDDNFHNFIDSISEFEDLSQIDQIVWFVFYKIEIKRFKHVNKEDIRPLFSHALLVEPKNFNQLWSYLYRVKKALIKQNNGFALNRKIYKNLQKSYSPSLPKPQIKKKLKKLGKNNIIIIPTAVLKSLPTDLIQHCNELNDNLEAENWISSMLLMRKILPLSIIRKFQKNNKEADIKDSNGEYFGSKKLLEKSKGLVQPRTYKELKEINFLLDSIQHNFTFLPKKTDVSPATIRLRVFLGELFK